MKKTIQTISQMIDDYKMYYYYEEMEGRKHWKFLWIFTSIISDIYLTTIGTILCRIFGHGKHFHDESNCSRDGGYESGYCDRCGFNFHIRMF
jgi:hypothetical protein